jgi:hypothetical protein
MTTRSSMSVNAERIRAEACRGNWCIFMTKDIGAHPEVTASFSRDYHPSLPMCRSLDNPNLAKIRSSLRFFHESAE